MLEFRRLAFCQTHFTFPLLISIHHLFYLFVTSLSFVWKYIYKTLVELKNMLIYINWDELGFNPIPADYMSWNAQKWRILLMETLSPSLCKHCNGTICRSLKLWSGESIFHSEKKYIPNCIIWFVNKCIIGHI